MVFESPNILGVDCYRWNIPGNSCRLSNIFIYPVCLDQYDNGDSILVQILWLVLRAEDIFSLWDLQINSLFL